MRAKSVETLVLSKDGVADTVSPWRSKSEQKSSFPILMFEAAPTQKSFLRSTKAG